MEQINFPLVSVITVTRNRVRVLPRAIKSVLNQSYRNIEYLIIDGASSDGTKELVEEFCNRDSRIVYIQQQQNSNPVEAIWEAFKRSNGEYITFLDDDDEYLRSKIEKQVDRIQKLDLSYGFVYCWMDYFDHVTGEKLAEKHDTLKDHVTSELIAYPGLCGTPTLFFRRDAFEKTGGWSRKIKMPSDWEFRTRASMLFKTDVVEEVLVNVYKNHEYERQSEVLLRHTKQQVINSIEFSEHFLVEFKAYFDCEPHKKIDHILSIIKGTMAIRDFDKAFAYAFELIKLDPTSIPKVLKKMFSGLVKPPKNIQ